MPGVARPAAVRSSTALAVEGRERTRHAAEAATSSSSHSEDLRMAPLGSGLNALYHQLVTLSRHEYSGLPLVDHMHDPHLVSWDIDLFRRSGHRLGFKTKKAEEGVLKCDASAPHQATFRDVRSE
jgi:hypothetical protein